MTTTYDYSDLKVNGITPTRVNCVHNGTSTQILRMKVNNRDYIHKHNNYNSTITAKIRLNASNVTEYQAGGCNPYWEVRGNLIVSLEGITITGDRTVTAIKNVTLSSGYVYLGNTFISESDEKTVAKVTAQTVTSYNPIANYAINNTDNGYAPTPAQVSFSPTITVKFTLSNGIDYTISFPALSVSYGSNIVVSETMTLSETIEEY